MIVGLKPYPARKDSGVPWLGEVPKHWVIASLRHRYSQCLGKMLDSKRITGSQSLPYLRNTDVQWDRINIERLPLMDISPAEYSRYTLKRGDLLVCEGGEVGRCALWSGELAVYGFQKALHRLRPRNDRQDVPRFMYYALRAAAARAAFTDGHVSTIAHLTGDKLRAHRFPFPPVGEQDAVVRFLDHADRRIRRYIRAKQKLIKLLEEQKQVIVHNAVTRGLDPNVRLKSSRVEWLGAVPEHWEVRKLKHLVAPVAGIQMGPFGASLTQLQTYDTGFKLFGQENTISGDFHRGSRWLTEVQFHSLRRYELNVGDLVLTRKGSIGKCRMVPAGAPVGIADSDTIRVRVAEKYVSPRFIVLLLHHAPYVQFQIQSVQRGAVLGGLNTATIGGLQIAVPPKAEQRALLEGIELRSMSLDRSMASVKREIFLLREYRTRLIVDVVTGKLDVREVAARLPDEAEEPEPLDDAEVVTDTEEGTEAAPQEAEA